MHKEFNEFQNIPVLYESLSYNCSSCDILNIIERKGGTTYANVRSHIKKTTGQCLDKR